MLSSFGLGEMPAHHVVALVHVRRCRTSNSEGPAGLKRALSAFCRLCVSHVVSGNAHFRTPSMSHTCPRSSDPAQDLDVCGGSSSRAPRSCIPLNMCMSIYVCMCIYMYIYIYIFASGFLVGAVLCMGNSSETVIPRAPCTFLLLHHSLTHLQSGVMSDSVLHMRKCIMTELGRKR